MTKYIIKRILIAIPVLIGITIIDYAIMCLAGSPLEMLKGPRVSEAAVEAKKIAMGLDKPFYIQYFVWLSQLLHGNMGYSVKSYQPVLEMIRSHLGPTLLLMGVSLVVSLILAVPAGIYSAIHQYSKGDYGDAGDRSCHIHGRKQYPLYPKCRTGDPAAGLFKDSKSQGNRKIPCYL